jgi:hypothetical protein
MHVTIRIYLDVHEDATRSWQSEQRGEASFDALLPDIGVIDAIDCNKITLALLDKAMVDWTVKNPVEQDKAS